MHYLSSNMSQFVDEGMAEFQFPVFNANIQPHDQQWWFQQQSHLPQLFCQICNKTEPTSDIFLQHVHMHSAPVVLAFFAEHNTIVIQGFLHDVQPTTEACSNCSTKKNSENSTADDSVASLKSCAIVLSKCDNNKTVSSETGQDKAEVVLEERATQTEECVTEARNTDKVEDVSDAPLKSVVFDSVAAVQAVKRCRVVLTSRFRL